MKIYLIDATGQIKSQLLAKAIDVVCFSDEIQALNEVESNKPDLLLLDYALRGKKTAEYIDLLLCVSPATSIIVIGDELNDKQILECFLIGAKGYQNQSGLDQYSQKLIKVVAAGEAWISRRLTALLLDAIRIQNMTATAEIAVSPDHIGPVTTH
jgi:DNA-binding NarL/FixJ family response regulator